MIVAENVSKRYDKSLANNNISLSRVFIRRLR
jgi:hypothetical protein